MQGRAGFGMGSSQRATTHWQPRHVARHEGGDGRSAGGVAPLRAAGHGGAGRRGTRPRRKVTQMVATAANMAAASPDGLAQHPATRGHGSRRRPQRRLAAATKVIHQDNAVAAHATHARWRHSLLHKPKAATTILAHLHASGCEDVMMDGERPVHDAITYLTNGGDRMDYATAVEKGLPIGSGNVEATCKSLVGIRMKRCGSRWHHETGNHILHLRALALSDRWKAAMDLLGARRRTAVRMREA